MLSGLEHLRTHEYVGESLRMPTTGRQRELDASEESALVGGAVETACSAFGHAANPGAGKAPRGLSAQISCA